jgi:hypothetical protein
MALGSYAPPRESMAGLSWKGSGQSEVSKFVGPEKMLAKTLLYVIAKR